MSMLFKVWATIALLCCTIVLISQTQPVPEFFPNLNTCNQRFCYLGITPSQTRWIDAKAILSGMPGLSLRRDTAILPLRDFSASATFSALDNDPTNATLVQGITIAVAPDHPVNLAASVLQWGSPCFVVPISNIQILLYPGMVLFVELDDRDRRMKLTSSVTTINLHDNGHSCDSVRRLGPSLPVPLQPWHGFTRYF